METTSDSASPARVKADKAASNFIGGKSMSDEALIVIEPERELLTRLNRSTWARLEKDGMAPRRVQLSRRRIGWRKRDILQWIELGPHAWRAQQPTQP